MARYLLATASVHTSAAAAEVVGCRLGADDTVVVLTVDEPDLADRDAGDAVNVARSRLLPVTVEVVERDGDPADAIRAVLSTHDADVHLVGAHRGDPEGIDDADTGRVGSTTLALLGAVDVPVVVPVPPG